MSLSAPHADSWRACSRIPIPHHTCTPPACPPSPPSRLQLHRFYSDASGARTRVVTLENDRRTENTYKTPRSTIAVFISTRRGRRRSIGRRVGALSSFSVFSCSARRHRVCSWIFGTLFSTHQTQHDSVSIHPIMSRPSRCRAPFGPGMGIYHVVLRFAPRLTTPIPPYPSRCTYFSIFLFSITFLFLSSYFFFLARGVFACIACVSILHHLVVTRTPPRCTLCSRIPPSLDACVPIPISRCALLP